MENYQNTARPSSILLYSKAYFTNLQFPACRNELQIRCSAIVAQFCQKMCIQFILQQLCCCAISSATKLIPTSYTRLNYAFLFLLTASLSYLMLTDWVEKKLASLTLGYFKITCGDGPCHGVIAVYRFCFASAIFHGALAIALYEYREAGAKFRFNVQNGGWFMKFVAYVSLVVICFFIPNGFFIGIRSWIYMPGAFLFILIQIVILIDFSYNVTEFFIDAWESNDDKRYLFELLLTSALH